MVRVYNCHPFSSQLIVPVEHEPDTFCCGRDILFVISAGCKVETFNAAQNGYEPLCAFATLGKVQKITYSDIGDYLAVIEEKSKVLSLRVYLNWRKCQAKETSRISIRMVGHALQAPYIGAPKDQMEIIEVPLSEPPVSISCCPVKGDLIVGCQNKVVLFRLKEEMVDGESPVLDFERFMIVHVALDLLEVAFCNGCLAVVADLEVLVLKLEYVQQVEGDSRLQVLQKAAPASKGVYGVENEPAEGASLSQEQDEFVLFQGPLELLGEDASASGVLISSEWTGMEGLNTELQGSLHLQQVLYRRFAPDLSHIYLDEKTSLHSVQLLPIFSAGDLESNSSPGRKEKQVLSLFCFFSLPHVGYLYSVGNMVQELSTYSYPEKAKQAVLTSQLLHVITRNNLLCYSVRCSAVAARDTDPEIDTNNKACPPFFLPVSALRMQLFIGLRAVCHSRNHLVLLAKAEVKAQNRQNESKKGSPQKSRTVNNTPPVTGESGWNLYCLPVIPTVQLCKEMVEYSLKYKTCSPQSYVHLLSEAHLMLKAALLDPDLGQCDSELLSAFSENCIQLGDCFSQFEMDDFHLTLPYYKMSGKSLSELISRRLLWENEPQKFGKGFMYYLKRLVYEEIEEPLSAETANQVLQVFRLSEPVQIPHALCSPCMRNVCPRTAWDHLERLASINPSPLVALTKAMVALRIEDQQRYQEAMGWYTEMRLVNGFVNEPNLLRHHGVVATELSHELQRTQPGLLVVAFVALLKNDKITLEEADLFFKGLCGKSDKDDEAETPQELVDFWEAMLISCTEEVMTKRLLVKLVSVYLHRTARRLKPDRKPLKTVEELISSCGHFGKIFPWIHTINASSSKPLGPSEDLQKLQSILCSSSIEMTSVLHLLQHLPDDDMTGLSIHALSDTRLGKCGHVTDLLLDRCPEALLPFATCEMQQGNQPLWWKKLLPELCKRTRGAEGENKILVSSLQETLAVVAAVLPPLDFLRILPDDGVASFFLPHLLECSRKNSVT